MPKLKPSAPSPAPLKSFRNTFPTLLHFMRNLNYVEGKAWPSPEDVDAAISDMCQIKPELMSKALALYQRGYEYASNTSFRMASYQAYATLCELPPFKTAFPTDNHLWSALGSPSGSMWPMAETVQGLIENKSAVKVHTLQRAIEVYSKAHSALGSGSCADVLSRIHAMLASDST